MIWTTLEASGVVDWITQQQNGLPAPRTYCVEDPGLTRARLRLLLPSVGLPETSVRLDPYSGLEIDFSSMPDSSLEELVTSGRSVLFLIDGGRRVFRWEDLNDEERGAPGNHPRAVSVEESTSIEGVCIVGPGGRLIVYDQANARSASLSVRGRSFGIPSRWRDPAAIGATVSGIVQTSPPDVRIRAAFGYYEASRYESQDWLRTAVVFVLDRPVASDGPRWRVAFVERATDSDDLPPTAGFGSASDACV